MRQAFHSLYYHGVSTDTAKTIAGMLGLHLVGFLQVRRLHPDETKWHWSLERRTDAAGPWWAFVAHLGIVGVWVYGPFKLERV